MRADLKSEFRNVLELHTVKISLLQKLRKSHFDKKTLLRNDDISGLIDCLEEDAHIMIRVDNIAVEIASAKKRICDISGIQEDEFDSFFLQGEKEESQRLLILVHECFSILQELRELNKNLENDLEKTLKKTGADIESLSRIRTLWRTMDNPGSGF